MRPEIQKVETPADKHAFIKLPWEIYKNDSRWVPPLLVERKKFLDPKANPFFDHAEVDFFLALGENRQPVGRIAFVVDHAHNTFHSQEVGFFGLFESIDDREVADRLLDVVYEGCRAKGLKKLLGPMNLSINHECGLLVEGFDKAPMLGIPYNPPYYSSLLEGWGLTKAKDLVCLKIAPFIRMPEYLEQAMVRIQKRNRFTVRCLRMDQFQKEIDVLWEIYNSAWERNWGFTPMTRDEFYFAADEMKHFIEPEFCLIAEIKDEPVGFSLTLPDINQVLKTLDGKLFPFGWARFLMNRKKIDSYRVLTLGVKKKFQRLGIDVSFYHKTYRRCLDQKVALCEMSWILEDNQAMLAPLYRMGADVYKRHRIYERTCEN
ncbi:MAG: hypothetical protein ACE5G9_00715 [Nitrospinales bacterium]